jgi:hypothetical protein
MPKLRGKQSRQTPPKWVYRRGRPRRLSGASGARRPQEVREELGVKWVTLTWAETLTYADILVIDVAHVQAHGYDPADPQAVRDYLCEFPEAWHRQVLINGLARERYITGVQFY